MKLQIIEYSTALRERWNEFVLASKNGTFLFSRDYMDYHAHRFADRSLVVCDEGGQWLALLPAHQQEETLHSHAGLTYGGFVVGPSMTTPLMLQTLRVAREHLRGRGIMRLTYKAVPHIYHQSPSEEDRYALWIEGASLVRRDLLSVVCPTVALHYQDRRRRSVRRAEKAGVKVQVSDDYSGFWKILEENLLRRHRARPVHSKEEIDLLRSRFPRNIQLFVAVLRSELLGGVVIFESARVAHAQYIASSEQGREASCLDLIFDRLLTSVYAKKEFFDFGSSTEQEGRHLNEGLVAFKEGFGASAVVHDFYELSL